MEKISKDILNQIPLFANISAQALESAMSSNEIMTKLLKKGEYLFFEGDLPENIYILLEGQISIGFNTIEGKQTTVALYNQTGKLFGEVFFFLDKPYDHFAQAIQTSIVMSLNKSILKRSIHSSWPNNENILKNLIKLLSDKTYYLNRRVHILSGSTLRQKIARALLLHRIDNNINSMTREEFAKYISATRPAVSKELLMLQDEGFIKLEKHNIIILDIEKMKSIV